MVKAGNALVHRRVGRNQKCTSKRSNQDFSDHLQFESDDDAGEFGYITIDELPSKAYLVLSLIRDPTTLSCPKDIDSAIKLTARLNYSDLQMRLQ